MSIYRIIVKSEWITRCLLLASFLVIIFGCDGLTSFHVSEISWNVPSWVPRYEYEEKVHVTISFSRAVDKNSFKAPGTVNIDWKQFPNTASNIAGTFRFSVDSKTVVFISNQERSDLFNIEPGMVKCTVTLVGTNAGAGVIADFAGEALDGNDDDKPGGNFVKVIDIPT